MGALKLSLKLYPVGAHMHPSLLPHPLLSEKSQDRGQRRVQIGKTQDETPKFNTSTSFFSLMGCPPLAYYMGARYMG
jgi:hypothetical protein